MKEQVFTLGETRNLIGILSEPDNCPGNPDRPAVLLFNAGMVHKIGPFRLNTLLARQVADAGFISVRFDLAGIGDSELGARALPQDEQMLFDVGLVIEYLYRSRQTKKIVIIGLCTGADNAHKAAVAFKQVSGAFFLDGYSYPTNKFFYNRLIPVILNPRRLFRAIVSRLILLKQRIMQRTGEYPDTNGDEPGNLFIWQSRDKRIVRGELQELVRRNTALCYIYTTGSFYTYNYPNQFSEAFKDVNFGNLLTEYYFPEMDHTYILTQDRDKLLKIILEWLSERF